MPLTALVLAAGHSSRMGRFKPLLPLGDGTVLSRAVGSVANVARVLVVCGNRAADVGPAATALGATPVRNPDYDSGMFSSVQAGVRALPKDTQAFFVLPVDIPLVRPSTARLLAADWTEHGAAVTYPRFRGERGHPPLIHASLIPAILEHSGEGGLRAVLDRFETGARDVDVADRGTLFDLDTPEDYAEAVRRQQTEHLPADDEIEALWNIAGTPANTRAHCRAVADAAAALAERLNLARPDLAVDTDAVRAAALLHDVAKIQRRHEQAGGELLVRHGFAASAPIVAAHRDLNLPPGGRIAERELVFLADKLVRGTDTLPLRERYMEKIRQWADDPEARAAIEGRLARAELILTRYEMLAGATALDIVGGPA